MKRVKQRADRAGQAKPEHTSGCRQFEGEDLSKYFNFCQMIGNSLVTSGTGWGGCIECWNRRIGVELQHLNLVFAANVPRILQH